MTNTDASDKRLLSFVQRIESLNEEKQSIADHIKDVFAEAKAVGFDVKTMRKLIKLRAMEAEKRREEQSLLETYAAAIQLDLF